MSLFTVEPHGVAWLLWDAVGGQAILDWAAQYMYSVCKVP